MFFCYGCGMGRDGYFHKRVLIVVRRAHPRYTKQSVHPYQRVLCVV